MVIKIFPYNTGSRSASTLRDAVGGGIRTPLLLSRSGSRYQPRPTHTVINWGSSSIPLWDSDIPFVANRPEVVAIHSNKLNFFRAYHNTGLCPDWTQDIEIAGLWQEIGFDIMERHQLMGHSGSGLRLVRPSEGLMPAPLYTKRIKGAREYRVHIRMNMNTPEIVSVQTKALRSEGVPTIGVPSIDYATVRVRTHGNGFVFTRHLDEDVPEAVEYAAHRVAHYSCLDFMAVDIIYNRRRDMALVIEVNTAPALAGETINDYQSTIKQLCTDGRSIERTRRIEDLVSRVRSSLEFYPLRVPTGVVPLGLLSEAAESFSV